VASVSNCERDSLRQRWKATLKTRGIEKIYLHLRKNCIVRKKHIDLGNLLSGNLLTPLMFSVVEAGLPGPKK